MTTKYPSPNTVNDDRIYLSSFGIKNMDESTAPDLISADYPDSEISGVVGMGDGSFNTVINNKFFNVVFE